MGLFHKLRSALSSSSSKSNYGVKGTRRMCVGDVKDDAVWFEVCSPDAEDFRCQYCAPKRHYTMSQREIDLIGDLSDDDRMVYEVEMESRNDNGTLWIVTDITAIEELPPGYVKGRMYSL